MSSTLLANDTTDPANESDQTLTVTSTQPAHGGRDLSPAANDGPLHAGGHYNGPDSFTYTITDNGTTNGAATEDRHRDGDRRRHRGQRRADAVDDTATAAEDTGLTSIPRRNDLQGPANERPDADDHGVASRRTAAP